MRWASGVVTTFLHQDDCLSPALVLLPAMRTLGGSRIWVSATHVV